MSGDYLQHLAIRQEIMKSKRVRISALVSPYIKRRILEIYETSSKYKKESDIIAEALLDFIKRYDGQQDKQEIEKMSGKPVVIE